MQGQPEIQTSCAMMLAIARLYRESIVVAVYGLTQSGKKPCPCGPCRYLEGIPQSHDSQLRSQPFSALALITAGFLAQEVAARDPEAAEPAEQLESEATRPERRIELDFPIGASMMMRPAPPWLRFDR